jgi:hypothetical protein
MKYPKIFRRTYVKSAHSFERPIHAGYMGESRRVVLRETKPEAGLTGLGDSVQTIALAYHDHSSVAFWSSPLILRTRGTP